MNQISSSPHAGAASGAVFMLAALLTFSAVAWFAGARQRQTILYCMLLAGPFMWFIFDWTLEIRLPVGLWPQWVGR